VSVPIID